MWCSRRRVASLSPVFVVEEIQRKYRVREWTPQNSPRIRAGVTKKDQKEAELKKNQTRRCYAKKTSIFSQTTGRHPPGARRETTEVKTRNVRPAALRTSAHMPDAALLVLVPEEEGGRGKRSQLAESFSTCMSAEGEADEGLGCLGGGQHRKALAYC